MCGFERIVASPFCWSVFAGMGCPSPGSRARRLSRILRQAGPRREEGVTREAWISETWPFVKQKRIPSMLVPFLLAW